ncbi:superkiller complex protein 3-like [Clytia hemisphaerica]|uniref:Tetratricopeptide repeat protein 37 n=1 Tax=Clytia hemisphaerica TaxID=252671 RepID=A0A7M5X6E7_9CNID
MDIKSELKSARDCIKKKEYKEAVKHCKNVLKHDKENYNAFVFIGKCATELEQYQQAKEAYTRAIEQNKEQPLAWQGLCSLLEKAKNHAWKSDMISAYTSLLENESFSQDTEKWLDLAQKNLKLLKNENKNIDVLILLEKILGRCPNEEKFTFFQEKINILERLLIKDPDNIEFKLKLKETFTNLIHLDTVDGEILITFKAKQLEFICKNAIVLDEKLDSFFNLCEKYHKVSPNNKSIADCFAVAIFNKAVCQPESLKELLEPMTSILPHIQDNDKNLLNGLLNIANGKVYFEELLKIQVKHQKCVVAFFHAREHHRCHKFQSAKEFIALSKENMQSLPFKESKDALAKHTCLMEIEILLEKKINSETEENEFTALFQQFTGPEVKKLILEIKFLIKTGNRDKAISSLENLGKLQLNEEEKSIMLQLQAEISFLEEKFYDAEIRLQEALALKDNYLDRFLLAKVYWKLGEEKQEYLPKAYTEFLKAAKLDAYYAPTFFYLGKYQKELIKDFVKAAKCLEKSFSLNDKDEDAANMLADLYLQQDNEDKAIEIYVKITSEAKVGQAIWAWIRLGLIYLKRKLGDEAIVCFQNGLRGDTTISHHWECLGDAYFEKGSFVSALKAFTKAVELDTDSAYCKFKMAKIKQMLKMDVEAIEDYKQLLKHHHDYVPALLGLSETYLHLEKEKLKIVFDGKAVECAQQVVDYVTRAVEKQPNFSILWKTIADALVLLHVVCDDKCHLSIPVSLQKIVSYTVKSNVAHKCDIMEIACRCYMVAIKIKENISSYWHDLAVCTYFQAMVLKGQEGQSKIIQSIQIIKKALALDSTNHQYWNTLGVVAGSSGPSEKICGHSIDDAHNPSLSQHAFIKSLELNAQDAHVWANLGILYLKHDKIEAAHEAFKKAQACDPALPQAWIGQAMIAECVMQTEDEKYEAMDLFRHATELQFHGEGSLAYAQWVCRLLSQIKNKSVLISTSPKADMSHLPHDVRRIVTKASGSLHKSTERHTDNAYAFNTLGVLLEQEGLFKQAEQAFACARKLLSTQQTDNEHNEKLRKVLLNQARSLCYLKQYSKAIEIYKVCDLQTPSEVCWLAFAYYHSGMLDLSIKEYEKALKLSTTDSHRSEILAALGMVYYADQKNDLAKSSLFESTQQADSSEHGIMALAALGLLHGDGTLATAALSELSRHRHKNMKQFEQKKIKLNASCYQMQGQSILAKRELLKGIHRYPQDSYFWSELAKYILYHETSNYKLSLHCTAVATYQMPTKIASLCDAMTTLAFPITGTEKLLKSVQRLLHNNPEDARSWVLLAAALNADTALHSKESTREKTVQVTNLALKKVDETLSSLKSAPSALVVLDSMALNQYNNLYSWMMQLYVISNIYFGDVDFAQMFADKVLPSLKGDEKAFEDFVFLKGLATIQENLSKGDHVSIENVRVMATLATKTAENWKWTILHKIYCTMAMPSAAEFCLRQLVLLGIQNKECYENVLLQTTLLGIKTFDVAGDRKWLDENKAILSQIFESIAEPDEVMILLRAIVFYQDGNKKAAMKYLQKLVFADRTVGQLAESLTRKWS